MEESPTDYDHCKFVNLGACKKFALILKNRSFFKEKGFHHTEDFFQKNISKKWWKTLHQSPRLAATMVVREFYTNLTSHVMKQVRGVLVDFNARSINEFYNLESVSDEAYNRLQEDPNYPEVLRMLTNGQGEWKTNSEGHVVHFKAMHLAYIPKV